MKKLKYLRLSNESDLECLAELFNFYRCFYGQDSDISMATRFLSERMRNNESVIYVAESENDALIGFAQLYPTFSSVSARRAWILNDLYVHEVYRGLGVARQLVQAALAHARSTGAACISLQTGTNNYRAQSLYESIGFKRGEDFLEYVFTLR